MTDATSTKPPSPELDVDVRQFYARQMHALDGGEFAAFGATFTDDGVFVPAGGGRLAGPEAIAVAAEAAAGRFNGGQPRHWFDLMTIGAADDGTISTRYYAVVTVTAADGTTLVEPTCLVRDTLVRTQGGELRNHARVIERDDHLAARAAA